MVVLGKNGFKKKIKQVREVGGGYLLGSEIAGMEKHKSRSTQKPKDRKNQYTRTKDRQNSECARNQARTPN